MQSQESQYPGYHIGLIGAKQEQVSRMGTAGEYIMVGSLVNSIISAFGTDGVALTIDGSSLETGHEIYDYTLGFFEG